VRWWIVLVFWALAQAQTLYVPLDNRPPNWLPCTWGWVVCPPSNLYRGPLGVDQEGLRHWLLQTPGQRLVVSLDALAYGGLVQSRRSPSSSLEALSWLAAILSWKVRYGGVVDGFGVIPRFPDALDPQRNLDVLRRLASWPFAYLEAPWDDALPGSPAVEEAHSLPLPTRPGADEAGQLLLLRAFRPGLHVRVVYDDPQAPRQVTPYEGIPLAETIQLLLKAARAQEVQQHPDLILLVSTGHTQATLREIVRWIFRVPIALADIAQVNRANPHLMQDLIELHLYPHLAAYEAWGTPANNLGSALAQGGLFLEHPNHRKEALAESYFQYLYSDFGRPWVQVHLRGPLGASAARALLAWLRQFSFPTLGSEVPVLRGIVFPWERSFEAWPELLWIPRWVIHGGPKRPPRGQE
jgi:hypothetical protein